MLEDLEKVKSEVLDNVLKQLNNVVELVDDAISVPHLNTKNILLKSIKETVKQTFDKFLIVSRMVKDMNFNEDVNDLYCKSLMKQFGFNDLDSPDYDKFHDEAVKNLRKSRPFFTPVSKQDYEAITSLSSDSDDNPSDTNKSVNELIEEGMKEYGYKKNDSGKWVEPTEDFEKNLTTVRPYAELDIKSTDESSTKKKAKSSKRKNRIKIAKEEKNEQ